MPRWVGIFCWVSGIAGGKVSVAPLILMVALRRGRSRLTTLAMENLVQVWMVWAMASAANTIVRCASITGSSGSGVQPWVGGTGGGVVLVS